MPSPIKYKFLPGLDEKMSDLCFKFQAIIDRNNKIMSGGRDHSYIEDFSFYSIIIPDLKKKTETFGSLPELAKQVGLSKIVGNWISENGRKCSDYLKETGKPTLSTKGQKFIRVGSGKSSNSSSSDDETEMKGGAKKKPVKNKKKTIKRKPGKAKKSK